MDLIIVFSSLLVVVGVGGNLLVAYQIRDRLDKVADRLGKE